MDAVNPESKAQMGEMLADKMAAQKQANMDKAEDNAELEEVASMDAVNEDSKAALEEKLAGVKKPAASAEEDVNAAAAASPAVSPPAGGGDKKDYVKHPEISIHQAAIEACAKLYSNDENEDSPVRHVALKVREKKKGGKRKYFADLASSSG